MHTVITDAVKGTQVVNVPDVGAHPDSGLTASWVGNTTREENFLSPGAQTTVELLPQEDYGVGARPNDQGEEYIYSKGGASRYIQSFGTMKEYHDANFEHKNV